MEMTSRSAFLKRSKTRSSTLVPSTMVRLGVSSSRSEARRDEVRLALQTGPPRPSRPGERHSQSQFPPFLEGASVVRREVRTKLRLVKVGKQVGRGDKAGRQGKQVEKEGRQTRGCGCGCGCVWSPSWWPAAAVAAAAASATFSEIPAAATASATACEIPARPKSGWEDGKEKTVKGPTSSRE